MTFPFLKRLTMFLVVLRVATIIHTTIAFSVVPSAKKISTSLASRPSPISSSFLDTVTDWLDSEGIFWYCVNNSSIDDGSGRDPSETDDTTTSNSTQRPVFPHPFKSGQPLLCVSTSKLDSKEANVTIIASTNVFLHILKSPKTKEDCLSPTCTYEMTNYVSELRQRHDDDKKKNNTNNLSIAPLSVIHLHEDVWDAKTDIVQSRLLMRLGRTTSRIFARKTKVRRIDAALAIPFLQEHHLWSATKAKYYYGLFLPSESREGGISGTRNGIVNTVDGKRRNSSMKRSRNNTINSERDDVLVAVATFSSRRNIKRNGIPHRSHELIRYCAQRDGVVVGGITKLVRAFIREQNPDDIVTVVDRDWGPGVGWHSLGFETVHVMAPLMMVVGREDGVRRHLVGAGIQSSHQRKDDAEKPKSGRPGLDCSVLNKLKESTDFDVSFRCLNSYGFMPVYDAGVERLLMIVQQDGATIQSPSISSSSSALSLWKNSVPSYTPTYYSANDGIMKLLDYVQKEASSN